MERTAFRATSQLALLAELHQRDLLDDAARRRRARVAGSIAKKPRDGLLARVFAGSTPAVGERRTASASAHSKREPAQAAPCN
jgi:ABC-type phosphonate transport system ATPase subunit